MMEYAMIVSALGDKNGFILRARERRIFHQNRVGGSYDNDSTLYNDTSRKIWGVELVKCQCGIPGTGAKYFFIVHNNTSPFVCRSIFICGQMDIDGQIDYA